MRYQLKKAVKKYNNFRPHYNLKGLTPMQYINNNILIDKIVSMSIKSVPAIIKIFTSFSLRFFKLFHTITFTFDIEDRCIVH